MWPTDVDQLVAEQETLASRTESAWSVPDRAFRLGGCWVCFPRGLTGPGAAGDRAWVASVVLCAGRVVSRHVRTGEAAASYTPGLLALRTGGLLEGVVGGLPAPPDVLLLDATGRDHPRRCGLALHLGAVLDLPTVGLTHRPLLAEGDWPADRPGATSPLRVGDEVVACWLRSREGARPLAVHPGWRTDLEVSVETVLAALAGRRTPEPLRHARRLARRARAGSLPA